MASNPKEEVEEADAEAMPPPQLRQRLTTEGAERARLRSAAFLEEIEIEDDGDTKAEKDGMTDVKVGATIPEAVLRELDRVASEQAQSSQEHPPEDAAAAKAEAELAAKMSKASIDETPEASQQSEPEGKVDRKAGYDDRLSRLEARMSRTESAVVDIERDLAAARIVLLAKAGTSTTDFHKGVDRWWKRHGQGDWRISGLQRKARSAQLALRDAGSRMDVLLELRENVPDGTTVLHMQGKQDKTAQIPGVWVYKALMETAAPQRPVVKTIRPTPKNGGSDLWMGEELVATVSATVDSAVISIREHWTAENIKFDGATVTDKMEELREVLDLYGKTVVVHTCAKLEQQHDEETTTRVKGGGKGKGKGKQRDAHSSPPTASGSSNKMGKQSAWDANADEIDKEQEEETGDDDGNGGYGAKKMKKEFIKEKVTK